MADPMTNSNNSSDLELVARASALHDTVRLWAEYGGPELPKNVEEALNGLFAVLKAIADAEFDATSNPSSGTPGDDVREARKALIDKIISAYHTTRLKDVPAADHILSKPWVEEAFAALFSPAIVPERLREALEPFAKLGDFFEGSPGRRARADDEECDFCIRVGDLRRAKAAYDRLTSTGQH